ncbi:S41 family peptidase [Aurantiacibacter spongiae]|uniref:Peptidase S41 n=1 Tax=Aurantiacibacter spongiae TaxID=2488860 RepID=A0A3N5DKG4_9SPHN|nr:S41 family peptidase [Aurantiacibacter spongiae]RPF72202.1 peptidase S41 [Aurantiacibacter spongiae]
MRTSKIALSLACLAMTACGGGGNGFTGGPSPTPTATPTPTPTSGSATCSLANRKQFALDVLNEWYLFPDLLDSSVNPDSYATVQDYIDALVAPARAQDKDRYFTYLTSIEEENAYYEQGASAGFGIRLIYDTDNRRLFVAEAFENAPALQNGIDRGTQIVGIGTSSSTIQSVNSLYALGGARAVYDALGPNEVGVTRVLDVIDASGVRRQVSVTKTEFDLDPVSDRYGAKIINDGGRQVGYVNLRTFISTADPDLRAAFDRFRNAGITEVIVDLRYNGGGAINIAELFGDLLLGDEVGNVFETIAFRPSKSDRNETYRIMAQPQAIAATRIAFIGTRATASASELVINGTQPYLGNNIALIGENTYGKPVGQSAFDLSECDDRLRAVTLQLENANGYGGYYRGLADHVPNTCSAQDDLSYQLGDPREQMVATALDFLAGRSCTPITAGATTQSVRDRGLLTVPHPDTAAQRETPGLF